MKILVLLSSANNIKFNLKRHSEGHRCKSETIMDLSQIPKEHRRNTVFHVFESEDDSITTNILESANNIRLYKDVK